MKKIYFLIVILPLYISSQDMSKSYIDSLPDDVKDDVISKIDEKDELEKPIYRRASSKLDKELDSNPSVYGSKFFDTIQTTFMPINEPNLDSSYILDFGDELEIQLIGQKDDIDTFAIERDGSINIPDIGKLVVSGLSLSDASSLIKAKVSNAYIGTKAFITLKNIRDINILIVGNVFNPGMYTLNGNSNMLHALTMAGGIDGIGSYRNINLIRNGEVIDSLDVYKVLTFGLHSLSSGLRSGDSILVRPSGKIVSVESGAKRNGKYELKDNESLSDLLTYASGFIRDANKENITIRRVSDGEASTFNLQVTELDSFIPEDGDAMYVSEFKLQSVTIEGAVKKPGTYLLKRGSTLVDLIGYAGGYEKFAYPFGGYLETAKALEINLAAREKLYNAFLTNLITNRNLTSDSGIETLLTQIKDAKVTGRVIAEFDIDVIKNNPKLDTTLTNGDRLIIPSTTQQVYIQGEVSNPGATRYSPGKGFDYYTSSAGGFLDNADKNNIFIVHPDGTTVNLNKRSRLPILLDNDNDYLIYPGSIIYVPQSADLTNSIEVASIWAPIISSIALSLTSLSVLNNSK